MQTQEEYNELQVGSHPLSSQTPPAPLPEKGCGAQEGQRTCLQTLSERQRKPGERALSGELPLFLQS